MSTPYDSGDQPRRDAGTAPVTDDSIATAPTAAQAPVTAPAPVAAPVPAPAQAPAIEDETHSTAPFVDPKATRETVQRRERGEFGGLQFGSAFLGWLTATGALILLIGLLGAAGTAAGVELLDDVDDAVEDAATIGTVGAVLLLVILFIAYLAGGYVAGRMARFRGAVQGFGVWLWAVAIAVVVAIVGYFAGDEYDVLAQFNAFPRIPLDEGELTTAALIAIALAAVVSLAGAVLGGILGMRYHRKVDRTGFGG